MSNIVQNITDLKTTIPALWAAITGAWIALGDVLTPFGISLHALPHLPSWVTTVIGIGAVVAGVYGTLFVKSHAASGVANTLNPPQPVPASSTPSSN